ESRFASSDTAARSDDTGFGRGFDGWSARGTFRFGEGRNCRPVGRRGNKVGLASQNRVSGRVRGFARDRRGPDRVSRRYAHGGGEQHIEVLGQVWKLRTVRHPGERVPSERVPGTGRRPDDRDPATGKPDGRGPLSAS